MGPTWATRTESAADHAAVRDLTPAAFDTPLAAAAEPGALPLSYAS